MFSGELLMGWFVFGGRSFSIWYSRLFYILIWLSFSVWELKYRCALVSSWPCLERKLRVPYLFMHVSVQTFSRTWFGCFSCQCLNMPKLQVCSDSHCKSQICKHSEVRNWVFVMNLSCFLAEIFSNPSAKNWIEMVLLSDTCVSVHAKVVVGLEHAWVAGCLAHRIFPVPFAWQHEEVVDK